VRIELKVNLSNNDVYELDGQINKYKKEFPCVIALACGLSDMGRWRELQNDHNQSGPVGMNQSQVHFIHKKEENFGKDPSDVHDEDDGLMGGGGLL